MKIVVPSLLVIFSASNTRTGKSSVQMACLGATTYEIMIRGRWNSDAWCSYVKVLLVYTRDAGADPVTFRIGDLGIVLDRVPKFHPELSGR